MTQEQLNQPLEDLTEDELIDLIIILGAFANLCYKKSNSNLEYKTILLLCLKFWAMNLLKIQIDDSGEYTIKNTDIPSEIIQYLTKQEKESLPDKVIDLVDKFVEITEKENLFNRDGKKKK